MGCRGDETSTTPPTTTTTIAAAATHTSIGSAKARRINNGVRDDVEPEFLFEIIKALSDHFVLRSDLEGAEFESAYIKAMLCLNEGIIKTRKPE